MSDDGFRVYGIDLGTTYSAIAYVDEVGKPAVCRNTDSVETTPSVVFFENADNVVVGSVAKNSVVTHGDRVVSLIKRQMGTKATYEFDGKTHTPESISSLILRQLAQDAADLHGSPASKAVITVPAYFGMLERDATRTAGVLAGLDVIGIVPEPVAAALHYEATTGASDKTILVYDLGGGTFDTTVISVSADEIEVLCTDGHDHLGGADWDARLHRHLMDAFREHVPPDVDPEDDEEFLQTLARIAEDTKKQLSKVESRPVPLRGAGVSARVEVTRAEFERLTEDLLANTVEIVRRTLDTLQQKAPGRKIDEVLLVGGSTKMPAVAARLREEFGWDPKLHDPDLAVAKGAALYALGRVVHREAEHKGVEAAVETIATQTGISTQKLRTIANKETRNVLPKAFGVKFVDTDDPDWRSKPTKHYVAHLVHANDSLPARGEVTAETLYDGQTAVEIELYEQSGVVAGREMEENKHLNDGAGAIEGLPSLPAGSPVEIKMDVDNEGLLQVHAKEVSTGKDLLIKVRVSVLSTEEVEEAAKVVAGLTVSS
ncbi:molecular chaperone Hsp70 [Lentzea guizhouensis]|uniref:Molecular chaperone Hsp70 n=1 Tax=Lentzea guizhouensis TaxID=1586287 RepID=A0A1B2HU87_9PSEU|nr:Hsp70 family protein [Lentzea guizhouensis]ANZ41300.1 molecular chaperone Hsp70 [Lentzea guizhouensis]